MSRLPARSGRLLAQPVALLLIAALAGCGAAAGIPAAPASMTAPGSAASSRDPATAPVPSVAAPSSLPAAIVDPATGPALVPASPTYGSIAYAHASPAQSLDLYLPADASGPVPLVLLVHGGGFAGGDADTQAGIAAEVLRAGYAVAAIDYRLAREAPFPAAVQDVKSAVRFLRGNAVRYGLDPDRFAAWGESAGGYLAAMAGVTGDQPTMFDDPADPYLGESAAVLAVVDWFGPSDFGRMSAQLASARPAACRPGGVSFDDPSSQESQWLGGALPDIPGTVREASLLTYIPAAGSLPVFAIATGDADCRVPFQQSLELADALATHGGTATLALVPGAGHMSPLVTAPQIPVALALLREAFHR